MTWLNARGRVGVEHAMLRLRLPTFVLCLATLSVGCVEPAPPPPARYPGTYFVRTDLRFTNAMSATYRLRKVVFAVDGSVVAARSDEHEELASAKDLELGSVTVPSGAHEVVVEAQFRGHGYGVFAYLSSYTFKARERYTYDPPDPRPRLLHCTGYELGGPTQPVEDRPHIRCEDQPLQ